MTASAIIDLADRLREIEVLCELDPSRIIMDRRLTKKETVQSNAVNRSAVVLLSAHLEGFIESISADVLDSLVSNGALLGDIPLSLRALHVDGNIKQLVEIADPSKRYPRIQSLFNNHSNLWRDDQPLDQTMIKIAMLTSKMSNPQEKAIASYFMHVGVDIRQFLTNSGKPTLLKRASALVDLRNQIAHGGQEASITYLDLDDYIRDVSDLCVEVASACAESVQGICRLAERPW